ncbi:MAG: GNAT family N-acetyltransferase [Acidimicrobiales bacterium]|jgi:CelD/BcsL family acetyltransferase involved in cellulose biosynthesis
MTDVAHRLFVEVVDRLEDVRPAWDDLVDRCVSPSPFLRSWWVDGIGAGPGGVLRIPLVFDGDELIGGIPLVHERWRRALPWLHTMDVSDYSAVASLPGREPEVLQALGQWLGRERSVVDLWCAVSGLSAIDLVPFPRWVLAETVAPYEELSESFEDYMASRSHNWRSTIRKSQHAAERRGWSVRCVGPGDIDAAIERLMRLHTLQWGTSEFTDLRTRFARAARAGAARGELIVFELVDGDSTLASQVWLEVAGCSYCYQGGRRSGVQSAGTLLMAAAIERACETGQRRIDLLRGDESYKAHWARQANTVLQVRGATGHLPPRFVRANAVRRGLACWREGDPIAPARWPPDRARQASTSPMGVGPQGM